MISARFRYSEMRRALYWGDVATLSPDTVYGQADDAWRHADPERYREPERCSLGTAADGVKAALAELGELPRGLTVEPIGMTNVLTEYAEQPASRVCWWPLS